MLFNNLSIFCPSKLNLKMKSSAAKIYRKSQTAAENINSDLAKCGNQNKNEERYKSFKAKLQKFIRTNTDNHQLIHDSSEKHDFFTNIIKNHSIKKKKYFFKDNDTQKSTKIQVKEQHQLPTELSISHHLRKTTQKHKQQLNKKSQSKLNTLKKLNQLKTSFNKHKKRKVNISKSLQKKQNQIHIRNLTCDDDINDRQNRKKIRRQSSLQTRWQKFMTGLIEQSRIKRSQTISSDQQGRNYFKNKKLFSRLFDCKQSQLIPNQLNPQERQRVQDKQMKVQSQQNQVKTDVKLKINTASILSNEIGPWTQKSKSGLNTQGVENQ